MARRAPASDMNMSGLGIIVLGIILIAAPLFIPLSVTGWLGGDTAITFYVYSQIPNSRDERIEYRLEGALVTVQKTESSQMTPLDVWGGVSPTGTDVYGLMTFYCSIGVHYWEVEFNGVIIDGYASLPDEGAIVRIFVYMDEGYADYSPDSAEYSETNAPDPEPAPEEAVDLITVVVETYPFDVDNVWVLSDTTGETFASGTTPLQFSHEGQFTMYIVFPDVEGYNKPQTWEGLVTSNSRFTGEYSVYVEPEPDADPETMGEETTSEPIDYTDLEITDDERDAYESQTVDDPDIGAESSSKWDTRIDIIRKAKSPLFLGMQVLGVLLTFIGAVQFATPMIKPRGR